MKYKVGDKTFLGEIVVNDYSHRPYKVIGESDHVFWFTESEIDAIIIKPKRNIDHLVELWDSGKRTDATTYFIQKMGVSGHLYLCLEHLMQEIPTKYRYPKLTSEELRAVRWLWDGGYESIVRDGCAYACYDRVKASVLINPITNLLADSSWITPKPINLAELLAAQEE